MNAINKQPTSTEIRFALRSEARRQKLAPAVLKIIEENVRHDTENLTHLERQERFLISEFIQMRPCPWCDSLVSWFEAVPPSMAETFSFKDSGPDVHECPHCQKRVVYSLPFVGPWFWRKHDDDLNPNRVVRT